MLAGLVLLTGAGVAVVATNDEGLPEADTSAGAAADPADVPTLADVTGSPSDGVDRPSDGGMTAPEVPERLRVSRAQAVAADLPLATADCAADTVSVQPSLPDSVVAGERQPVPIQLALATSDTQACTLKLDPETVLVQVTDDAGEPIWELATCWGTLQSQAVTLRPSWVSVIPLDWSGRISGHRCNPRARAAKPGSYVVESALLGGEPASDEFSLRRPPPPPKPDPDSDPDDVDSAESDTVLDQAGTPVPQT
jgi:hypothetical protein